MLVRATGRWHIASVSWGKDSLAMLLMLIERGYAPDEVVYYDTGMEFRAIYDTRDAMLATLDAHGIAYTELRPKNPMWWDMFCRPVRKRGAGDVHRRGYGWCGGLCRWGTKAKTSAIDRYARNKEAVQLVGIAADETERLGRANNSGHVHPLAEWGVTEVEALAYCYAHGFEWMERGVRLYDVLDRVSCWCCRNKNLKELRAIHDQLPEYWERLVAMEEVLGPMKKGKTLPEIGDVAAREALS